MNTCLELPNSPEEQTAKNIANWCEAYAQFIGRACHTLWHVYSILPFDVMEWDIKFDVKRNNWDFILRKPILEPQYRRLVFGYQGDKYPDNPFDFKYHY